MLNGNELSDMIIIPVVLICCIVGYLIKNFTKIPNKYIPLIMVGIGVVASIVNMFTEDIPFSLMVIVSGAVSGLSATGSYELIVNSFNLKADKKTNEVKDDEVIIEETIDDEYVEDNETEDTE